MESLRRKNIRQMTERNELSFGLVMGLNEPAIAELAGLSGYDFIRVDGEHSAFSLQDICAIVRAADGVGLPVVLRLTRIEDLTALVDFGVAGFMVPHVRSGGQAAQLVEALKYAPTGRRGYTTASRAHRFGFTSIYDYVQIAAEETLLMVQIEDEQGIANMEQIIETPGVDMICSGRGDISQALGLLGQTNHPDVVAIEDRLIELARKHGKTCQLTATNPELAQSYIERGVRAITLNSDVSLLIRAMRGDLQAMESVRQTFQKRVAT